MMNQIHTAYTTRTRRDAALCQVVWAMGLAQSPTNIFDGKLGQETPEVGRRTTQ